RSTTTTARRCSSLSAPLSRAAPRTPTSTTSVPFWSIPMPDLVPTRALLAVALLALAVAPAAAALRLCNAARRRLGVAPGYQDGSGWTTEGWWTIAGESCETVLRGKLANRYFYVHAVDYDRGGEWAGPTTMCTDDKTFVIRGNTDCEKRSFGRAGFM